MPPRPWLALLCLPGLTLLGPGLRRGAAQEPVDLFSVWQTFSPSAAEDGGEVPGAPWLSAASAVPPPRLPSVAPTTAWVDPHSSPDLAAPVVSAASPWERLAKTPRKMSQKSAGEWGDLTAQVEVTDLPQTTVWDDPGWKRAWQTDQSLRLPVVGPVFVFGQVGANSDEAGQANMKVSGRTGLACKVPVGSLAEFTFRSGPGVSCTDPLRPLRAQERSDWLLEVQARWPLLFGIGLEYQGSALPALTPLEQDKVNQDVRLAFPVGQAGKLKVGARRQWTSSLTETRTWTDTTQLYLGLELAH